jgi:hypothetical protein
MAEFTKLQLFVDTLALSGFVLTKSPGTQRDEWQTNLWLGREYWLRYIFCDFETDVENPYFPVTDEGEMEDLTGLERLIRPTLLKLGIGDDPDPIGQVKAFLNQVRDYRESITVPTFGYGERARNSLVLPFLLCGVPKEVTEFALERSVPVYTPAITAVVEGIITKDDILEYLDIPIEYQKSLLYP